MFLHLTMPAWHATCPRSSDEAVRLSIIRSHCQLLAADNQSGCCPECQHFCCPAFPGLAPHDRPVLATLHLGDLKDTPGKEQRGYCTLVSSSVAVCAWHATISVLRTAPYLSGVSVLVPGERTAWVAGECRVSNAPHQPGLVLCTHDLREPLCHSGR